VAGVAAAVAEGWARRRPKEFCQFLRYASGSLEEAWTWLEDGAARGHYPPSALEPLRVHERICGAAIRRLRESLERF
jgi:four helix bundle protein